MPSIRRSLSTMVVAGALATPACAMPIAHAAVSAAPVPTVSVKSAPSQHAMSVDGVTLAVTNPDMPIGASFAPKPGDSVQSASAEAVAPFRFFSVTAVPFGEQLPKSDFPVAASGSAAAWRAVGGPSTPGPVATLFGQKVVGQVRHEADGTSKIQTVQWIVEAGNRMWVVRAEHAEPNVPTGFGAGIAITAANVAAPTTVNVTAANAGAQPHASTMAPATAAAGDPAISFGTLAPVPSSYWDHGGGTCDGGYYGLLNEKIDGLQVCGYSNGNDRPTGWGGNEWECAELPMRYAIQRWGLTGNDGGNGKDQADNLTAALNNIHPGRFALRGNSLSDHTAPQPGDVVAYYDSSAGHTGVVIASHVDASGNGTIDMVHENWNEVPSTPGEWDGIPVSNGMVENVLGGSGDVHWMHDTSSDVAPSVSAPSVSGNSGTVTVTGTSNQPASGFYVHLQQNGSDVFVSHPELPGGTSFSYQLDTRQVPNGTYQVVTGAVINNTSYYSLPTPITIANGPAAPSVAITSPAAGSQIGGQVTLTASASDSTAGAAISVQYYVDGTAVGSPSTAAPYSVTLNALSLAKGAHTLTARATASTATGSVATTSAAIPVTVIGTKPSIAALPDGSWQGAWQGTDGMFWTANGTKTSQLSGGANRPDNLGVFGGSSPSIATLTNGTWEAAWRGTDGELWVANGTGANQLNGAANRPDNLGVQAGTSPSIVGLPDGSWQAVWQGTDGELWTANGGTTNQLNGAANRPDNLGVQAGTSPSITLLSGGHWEAAWQGTDGELWVGNGDSTSQLNGAANRPDNLGVQGGTSPSIVGLSDGSWQAVWQGTDGELWTANGGSTNQINGAANRPDNLGVEPGTSPSITALSGGTWEAAWQGTDGELWVANGSTASQINGAANRPDNLGVEAGTSPSIARLSDGSWQAVWQGTDGELWTANGGSTSQINGAANRPDNLGVA